MNIFGHHLACLVLRSLRGAIGALAPAHAREFILSFRQLGARFQDANDGAGFPVIAASLTMPFDTTIILYTDTPFYGAIALLIFTTALRHCYHAKLHALSCLLSYRLRLLRRPIMLGCPAPPDISAHIDSYFISFDTPAPSPLV